LAVYALFLKKKKKSSRGAGFSLVVLARILGLLGKEPSIAPANHALNEIVLNSKTVGVDFRPIQTHLAAHLVPVVQHKKSARALVFQNPRLTTNLVCCLPRSQAIPFPILHKKKTANAEPVFLISSF